MNEMGTRRGGRERDGKKDTGRKNIYRHIRKETVRNDGIDKEKRTKIET